MAINPERRCLWESITEAIRSTTGRSFRTESKRAVGGGCINETLCIEGGGRRYFVKLNRADRLAMLEAEAEGLGELAKTRTVRVPAPVCAGADEDRAWLVLEWIELGVRPDSSRFGGQLAALHGHNAPRFGWRRDNTQGSTPQINTWTERWVDFWRDHRLGFQLELAARRGYGDALQKKGARLMAEFPVLFRDYQPTPSLLHGDLWGGNHGADRDGNPVVFDPAVYYGDHEAELAMTELFGSFDSAFYRAYRAIRPLAPNYRLRKTFYNLYHILNHLNLFGGGYGRQAEAMMDYLLNEISH